MASSPLLRLSAFSALFLAILGCQPSSNPTNGDSTLYTDMTFTMEDVYLDARWTGGVPKAVRPQSLTPPTPLITKDITIIVSGVLGQYKLPQDMVTVTVASKDNEGLRVLVENVLFSNGTCEQEGYAIPIDEEQKFEEIEAIVLSCSAENVMATKPPSPAKFTIIGQFKSSMGATKDMWNTLAEKLQEKLEEYDYVSFNSKDLSVEPTSST